MIDLFFRVAVIVALIHLHVRASRQETHMETTQNNLDKIEGNIATLESHVTDQDLKIQDLNARLKANKGDFTAIEAAQLQKIADDSSAFVTKLGATPETAPVAQTTSSAALDPSESTTIPDNFIQNG